jgi:hypothetical protein
MIAAAANSCSSTAVGGMTGTSLQLQRQVASLTGAQIFVWVPAVALMFSRDGSPLVVATHVCACLVPPLRVLAGWPVRQLEWHAWL